MIEDKYYLANSGTCINMNYESKKEDKIFFQVKEWSWAGTPNYCDPKLKVEYNKHDWYNVNNNILGTVNIDPFKADIYSAGVAIYEAATGNSVQGINNQEFD